MFGRWYQGKLSPHIPSTPCIYGGELLFLLHAGNAPSARRGTVGSTPAILLSKLIWGLGACVQPCTTVQRCTTKTLSLHGEQPHWRPAGTGQIQQPVQESKRGIVSPPSLPSPVQISVPHMPEYVHETRTTRQKNTQHNLSNMLWPSWGQAALKLWLVCGSSSVLCRCTLLSEPGVRRHHMLVTHLPLISDWQ